VDNISVGEQCLLEEGGVNFVCWCVRTCKMCGCGGGCRRRGVKLHIWNFLCVCFHILLNMVTITFTYTDTHYWLRAFRCQLSGRSAMQEPAWLDGTWVWLWHLYVFRWDKCSACPARSGVAPPDPVTSVRNRLLTPCGQIALLTCARQTCDVGSKFVPCAWMKYSMGVTW
jgi:hypothetical protein